MICCMQFLELLRHEPDSASKGGRVDTQKPKRRRSAGPKVHRGAVRKEQQRRTIMSTDDATRLLRRMK